jgi:hypothetical protein
VSAGSEQLGRGFVLGRTLICAEFASIKAACLELLEDIAKAGEPHGTGVTRLWANMDRAVDDCPGVHAIVEYELRLNSFYQNTTWPAPMMSRNSARQSSWIFYAPIREPSSGYLSWEFVLHPPDEWLLELKTRSAPTH